MAVIIESVQAGSLARKKNISAGDSLISVNGNEVNDVLDYRFYLNDKKLRLVLKGADGKMKIATVIKDEFAKVYASLKKTIDEGKELDLTVANAVAAAMKDWAVITRANIDTGFALLSPGPLRPGFSVCAVKLPRCLCL